jgi:LPS sulfotransferase NodH
MNQKIKGRFFLVGCPRSGTTLLQSLIVAHSQIASFPESKFFQRIVIPDSIYSKFKLAPLKSRQIFNNFLEDINRPDLKKKLPLNAFFVEQYTKSFIQVLDTVTLEEYKSYWLEKTPEHLRRINTIEKLVEDAKFIHIVRNGIDVIASLYEMTQKYPEIWGKPRELERYINRWETDILISSYHLHKPNHFLVKYEDLVANPPEVLSKLCEFMGLPYEESMLEKRVSVASSLIRKREYWKQSVNDNLQQSSSNKFERIFDANQRQYILERLAAKKINLDNLPPRNCENAITDVPSLL